MTGTHQYKVRKIHPISIQVESQFDDIAKNLLFFYCVGFSRFSELVRLPFVISRLLPTSSSSLCITKSC